MKKLEKKIRKIGKEEFGNYDIDGYRIGQFVRLNSEYDYYTIYEIVALDTNAKNKSNIPKNNILLNDFDKSKSGIEHFENLPIVYKKGAKKKKYTKWVTVDEILEVVE